MKPRGSLRRFPVVGSTLAFLTGLLLAGVLNIPGFSEAQQQDSRYTAGTTAAPTSPPTGVANLQNLSEAFASVALNSMRMLGVDESKVNVNGGAIALGHPIGASGARLLMTLVNELKRRGGGLGVAAICSGGGQGDAVIVEVNGA